MSIAFSHNDEEYRDEGDETREGAVLRCIDEDNLEVGSHVWTAIPKPTDPKRFLPGVERLLEGISERAYDECGECAESWLENLPKEKLQDLEETLHGAILAWMERNNELPYFWNVEQVQKHEVTPELIAQATGEPVELVRYRAV